MIGPFPPQLLRTLLHITPSGCTDWRASRLRGGVLCTPCHCIRPKQKLYSRGLGQDGPPKTLLHPGHEVCFLLLLQRTTQPVELRRMSVSVLKRVTHIRARLCALHVGTDEHRGRRQNATRAMPAFRFTAGSTWHIDDFQLYYMLAHN